MLTNKIVDGAKPKERQYKLSDAHGLYIVITPRNVKSWRCNYKQDGKHQTKVFGQYPAVSVAQARLLNAQFKDELASGVSKIPTFAEVKREWYKVKLPTLKNIKHRQQVCYRLDTFCQSFDNIPINAIKRADLVKLVQSIQQREVKGAKTLETALRVAMHLRQLFDYAVDVGIIEGHAANNLSRILQTPKTKHMNCISPNDAGALMLKITQYDEPITRLGLLFAMCTFVRTNELRQMEWSEIKDNAFWVIPESRMKMGKPHVVPLSDYALSLLAELKLLTGDFKYVFHSPSRPNKPISENTLLFALYRLGYRGLMTVHGFRALASTVLNEQSPFSHDVIERQLAHRETDAVRAAYNRAEYLDERVKLMAWYANWLNACLLSAQTSEDDRP